MEEKYISAIDKIVRLCAQDSEFDNVLRKKLGIPTSFTSISLDDDRINQIYEYCIEKVLRKQAKDFYSDFPIPSIINNLVDDYCRMEFFRRKDAFGDFCLALYQQIECITNKICAVPDLNKIAEHLWGYPAYVKSGKDIKISIYNRMDESDYSIASLIFMNKTKAVEKSKSALQTLYAIDKIRAVVYFLGYKATMKSSDYEGFIEITSLLSDIYQCRNMNHRGNVQTEWEKKTLDRILPRKAVYYLKFLGALTLFVDQVKEGWVHLDEMKSYAQTLPIKELKNEIKILGKIDIKEDGRKRFYK